MKVAERVHKTALRDFNLLVYHGQGCAGKGQKLDKIAERITKAIEKVFKELNG
ncbi:hypothetical protein N0V88_001920 [Collariella sp. IMI 366227]|nr:hypothetical protein N0V88_001920 [Collariella sp. IMI 366227]